jgi:transcriptional regulator with XRE-family HTH domain
MKIGAKVKDLRTRQRITLHDLSQRTGLTTSFLSQLERNLTSPSVASLEKIAGALNTKVGYFFEREEGKELTFVRRAIVRKVIDKERNISCETLASGFLNIKMQPQVVTLGPGAELAGELISLGGEKFGMALKGKVELLYGSEKLILEEGDSIYCVYTQKPQRMINVGQTEARFLWILFSSL